MQLSSIIRLLKFLAKAAVYVVIIAGLLFVGLTQTDRGRQVVNTFLVDRFNDQFAGQLRIEEIEGTIIGNVYARNVRLLDPEGRVTATAASIELAPRWLDLIRQRVTVNDVTIDRPVVHFVRSPSDSAFTLAQALRPEHPSPNPTPWRISAAQIDIRNGEVHIIDQGSDGTDAVPWLFDYRNSSIDSIDIRATVEWMPESKLVDVQRASAYSRDLPLKITDLQGQFVANTAGWALNQVMLTTDESRLAFEGSLARAAADGGPPADSLSSDPISFSLRESTISGNEISRFFPGVNLRDSVRVAVALGGHHRRMAINTLQLSRGETAVHGTGAIVRAGDSLAVSLEAPNATVNAEDIVAVWPRSPAKNYTELGQVALSLSTTGVFDAATGEILPTGTRFSSTTQLEAEGAMGYLGGDIALRSRPNRPAAYDINLTARELNLRRIRDTLAPPTALNGTISVSGSGLRRETVQLSSEVALAPSRIGIRSIDSARVSLEADSSRIAATTRLYQPSDGGFLYGEVSVSNFSRVPSYSLYLSTTDLNLKPLVPTDTVATRLNGSITANARGRPNDGFTGEVLVSIDSSSVLRPHRSYPIRPAVTEMRLRPRFGEQPRLSLRGDLFDLTADGDFTLITLLSTGQLWSDVLGRALRRVREKPRIRYGAFSGDQLPAWSGSIDRFPANSTAPLHAEQPLTPSPADLEQRLEDAGLSPGTRGTIDLHLHRSELLTTIFTGVPVLEGSLRSQMSWAADQDSLRMNLSVRSDTLAGPRLRVRELDGQIEISSLRSEYTVPATTSIFARVDAGYVERPFQTFRDNRLTFDYQDRRAAIHLESSRIGDDSALQSDIELALLEDRNRITIRSFDLSMRDSRWRIPDQPVIDLYDDAVVFRSVRFQSPVRHPSGTRDSLQYLTLDGALSSHPSDTAHVESQNLQLGEVSRILAMNNPVGGTLTADIALTRGAETVETTGTLFVQDLTYDSHPLGQLTASSQYDPGRDALNLDVRIAHEDPLPGGIQNDVRVQGALGLPQRSTSEEYLDPGSIGLTITAGEADLFFFENIFPGVIEDMHATASGQVDVRGNFRRPVFEGALDIANGSTFYQPDFNLNYAISGPIEVDTEGFHVDGMTISDPTGGTAALSGDILFNEYEYFSFDLQAELDELQTINVTSSRNLPFYGQIWSSGTAHLTGPLYDALLRSPNVVTTPNSELYIPVTSVDADTDERFIVFADSTGKVPDLQQRRRRENILADRPPGERPFLEGLDMNLNIDAPRGSTVHLVFDPLLGDVVEAVGSGRVQLGINEGEFSTFGTFNVTGGEYLFTAGDMFSRRFQLSPGGTITWDGDPIDAQLDIPATYHTRASLAGLPGYDESGTERIPVVIELNLTGRVTSPITDLRLAIDRDQYANSARITSLEPILNDEERAAEYATSVLLTNSFRLTLTGDTRGITESVDQLAFSTVSQLVANQLNRFINHALNNVDVNLGVQRGTTVQDLDVTYGVALYLLDERLVIRGQGVYETSRNRSSSDNLQGTLTVEIRMSPTVSMEVFYRREEGLLESASTIAPTYGAGVSYQTDFTNWRQFLAHQWNEWKAIWRDVFDFLAGGSSSSSPTTTTPADSTTADSVAYRPIILRKTNQSSDTNDSDSLPGN